MKNAYIGNRHDELLPVDIYNLMNGGIIFFAALYGVLFENDEEAAFSNYRLWESAGFIIAFILQTQVSGTKMCYHHFKYFGQVSVQDFCQGSLEQKDA